MEGADASDEPDIAIGLDNEVLNYAKTLLLDSNSSASMDNTRNNQEALNNRLEAAESMEERVLNLTLPISGQPPIPQAQQIQPGGVEMGPFMSNHTVGVAPSFIPQSPPGSLVWNISTGYIHRPPCSNDKCWKEVENYKNEINTLKSDVAAKEGMIEKLTEKVAYLKIQTKDSIKKAADRYKLAREHQEAGLFHWNFAREVAKRAKLTESDLDRIIIRTGYKTCEGLKSPRLISARDMISDDEEEGQNSKFTQTDQRFNEDLSSASSDNDMASISSGEIATVTKSDENLTGQSVDYESDHESSNAPVILDTNDIGWNASESLSEEDIVTRYMKQVHKGGGSNTCTSNSIHVDLNPSLQAEGIGMTIDELVDINLDEEDLIEQVEFDISEHRRNPTPSSCKPCCRFC